jgi:hypothetical protein
MNTTLTRIAPLSIFILSLTVGPTETETPLSLPLLPFLLCWPDFEQEINRKWETTQTAIEFYKLYTVGKLSARRTF